MPVFDHLAQLPDDPILGLVALYANDTRASKMDLGVGIYKDPQGRTPVLKSVKAAEAWLLENESSKAYVSTAGVPGFENAIVPIALGASAASLVGERYAAIQTPGGTGGLRLMAEFLTRTAVKTVLVGVPTWPIHQPIFERVGLNVSTCAHLREDGTFNLEALLAGISELNTGDAVLLHACCHNPTGIDPTREQWHAILDAVKAKGVLPLFDMAYQGFGDGLDEDAWSLRLFCDALPEVLASVSCSKNFGIYRERTGALLISSDSTKTLAAVRSQVIDSARSLWSMPPSHGGQIVTHILGDGALKASWLAELNEMCERINSLRNGLCDALKAIDAFEPFQSLAVQKGMFSSLGMTPEYVLRIRETSGVYLVGSGRINVSGLSADRLDELAAALKAGLV
ncbi:amino acid aminotransferase [Pseudomonas matsuisoli]|uniref:Aromatic-amino-acid aminotransferase n=1 Tax=Pseudomonas matsuisoli TaxID=1515666 RepID=A0A917PLA3_9PSED|nr:amino acid aminotransferase [Pseudomonas matsuisoli]GGJ83380.1 aromatic-amino-acid aminotransferase [Pseudomonas matsuisoli]